MKNKFNAAMVTETDKNTLVELREQFDLTEKEVVQFVLKQALRRRKELTDTIEKYKADLALEKEARKAEQLANYKAKAKQARVAMRKEKLTKKLKELEVTEPTESPVSAEGEGEGSVES